METCYKCGKQEPYLCEITIEYQGQQKDIKVCGKCLVSIADSSTSARFEPNATSSQGQQTPAQTGAPKEKGSGCFIATSCYGSAESPEVLAFRQFRDRVLLPSLIGVWVVRRYYAYAPGIARYLDKHQGCAVVVRRLILNPILTFIRR